jgi:hypothetical protein
MFEFPTSQVQPLWYTGLGAAASRTGSNGRSFLQILGALPGWFACCSGTSAFPATGVPAGHSPSTCSHCCC